MLGQKMLGPKKNFKIRTKSGPKKTSDQKNFGSKKNVGPKKNFGSKRKFWVQKKILGQKKILVWWVDWWLARCLGVLGLGQKDS